MGEKAPDAQISIHCEEVDKTLENETIMMEPVLTMEDVVSGEGVIFLIVYGDHGTDNKKMWRPCYKSEIT